MCCLYSILKFGTVIFNAGAAYICFSVSKWLGLTVNVHKLISSSSLEFGSLITYIWECFNHLSKRVNHAALTPVYAIRNTVNLNPSSLSLSRGFHCLQDLRGKNTTMINIIIFKSTQLKTH